MFNLFRKPNQDGDIVLLGDIPHVPFPLPGLQNEKYICVHCGDELQIPWDIHAKLCKGSNNKEKFKLEFDEPPALVFVQERESNKVKVYQDGKELHGVRSIDIRAGVGKGTTHTIEFITGATRG